MLSAIPPSNGTLAGSSPANPVSLGCGKGISDLGKSNQVGGCYGGDLKPAGDLDAKGDDGK